MAEYLQEHKRILLILEKNADGKCGWRRKDI